MIIGGLDVGTTGCKLTAFDHEGNFIYNSYKEYEVTRKNGEHELDASVIFCAVCDVISDVAKNCSLSAIGVTTFGETFVALDKDNNVAYESKLVKGGNISSSFYNDNEIEITKNLLLKINK